MSSRQVAAGREVEVFLDVSSAEEDGQHFSASR
jgi:hypothetical protein